MIFGGQGADRIRGGRGGDYLIGGAGNDAIQGGAGNDWVFGDATNSYPDGYTDPVEYALDFANRNRGNDRITGDVGNDIILGGNGNDGVRAGVGTDIVVGGEGSGVVAFDKGTGEEIWRSVTAQEMGYASPLVVEQNGKRALIVWHDVAVQGLDVETGQRFWRIKFPENDPCHPRNSLGYGEPPGPSARQPRHGPSWL